MAGANPKQEAWDIANEFYRRGVSQPGAIISSGDGIPSHTPFVDSLKAALEQVSDPLKILGKPTLEPFPVSLKKGVGVTPLAETSPIAPVAVTTEQAKPNVLGEHKKDDYDKYRVGKGGMTDKAFHALFQDPKNPPPAGLGLIMDAESNLNESPAKRIIAKQTDDYSTILGDSDYSLILPRGVGKQKKEEVAPAVTGAATNASTGVDKLFNSNGSAKGKFLRLVENPAFAKKEEPVDITKHMDKEDLESYAKVVTARAHATTAEAAKITAEKYDPNEIKRDAQYKKDEENFYKRLEAQAPVVDVDAAGKAIKNYTVARLRDLDSGKTIDDLYGDKEVGRHEWDTRDTWITEQTLTDKIKKEFPSFVYKPSDALKKGTPTFNYRQRMIKVWEDLLLGKKKE